MVMFTAGAQRDVWKAALLSSQKQKRRVRRRTLRVVGIKPIPYCGGKRMLVWQTFAFVLAIQPSAPKQGETVAVWVKAPQASAVWVTWQGKQLPAYPMGDGWRALLGIPADLPAGRYPLIVHWQQDGIEQKETRPLTVHAKQFATQRIRLSSQKRKLFASPKVAQEKALWRKVLETATPEQLWDGTFLLPVKGRITTPFGLRRIYVGLKNPHGIHRGIDFAAPFGTLVRAANDGQVLLARSFVLEGNAVLLNHGQGVLTAYFHLASIKVREGDFVRKGQIIGAVGSSGVATGAHLHWALYVGGVAVDPLQWTKEWMSF